MKRTAPLIGLLVLAACTTSTPDPRPAAPSTSGPAVHPMAGARAFTRLDLPNLDDNVRHDTLLIYTTHAVGNGEFVMAARNKDDTREGLRLILYRPRADSSAEVLALSKPAFDSDVMLPTFFATGDTADGIVVLANYGAWDSWGQNAFWLKDHRFRDLGWIDVAERTWETRVDSLQQRRLNIAPKTLVTGIDGQFDFSFTTDSVQLYDDLLGAHEVMVPAGRIHYRYDGQRMLLVVDGKARLRKDPL